jgi:beta-exotoxin I transport system permease protein
MTMSMTIFKHELRMSWRSVISWSVAIAALILLYISMFSSFSKDAELLNEMLANFPPALLTAFGMTKMDLATVLGYFSFAFLFAQLCLAIQAANYGFGLVSVEEREWTADFLLAKPVGRAQVLTSKLLAALVGLTVTNAATWICSFVFIELFRAGKPYETKPLVMLLLTITLFQLFFLAVGLLISLLVKRVRSVVPYSMALAFGMYVLNVFGDMLGESVLEKITPFKHFDARYILANAAYNAPLMLISIVVIAVCLAASYMLYAKRNIPAVV